MPGRPSPSRFLIAFALAAAGSAIARPSRAQPIAEALDYGIMTGRRAPVPETAPPSGPTTGLKAGPGGAGLTAAVPMSHQRYLERTDAVEARLYRPFGLRLRVSPGPGEQEPAAVAVHAFHPASTAPDGATSAEDDFPSSVVFWQTHAGFTFGHA